MVGQLSPPEMFLIGRNSRAGRLRNNDPPSDLFITSGILFRQYKKRAFENGKAIFPGVLSFID
jgi:hypothetical protein